MKWRTTDWYNATMMMSSTSIAAVMCFLSGLLVYGKGPDDDRLDLASLSDADHARLIADVRQRGKPPMEYLVSAFASHDVVLLGETHHVRENARFIADSLSPLYERAGVTLLVTEFIRSRDNDRLQRLMDGAAFDRPLALSIMRDYNSPVWGFQEYLDILESAWRVNHSRPDGAAPFRVVGMDSEWEQIDQLTSTDPRKSFDQRMDREKHMIATVTSAALAEHRKALVHVGRDHTYTCQGARLGAVLTHDHGPRVFQICLHFDFPGVGKPATINTVIEDIFAGAGGGPVGLDIVGSPLGRVVDRTCVYWQMMPNGTLADFCQGYIYLVPLGKLHRAAWIPGFIGADNVDRARAAAEALEWIKPDQGKTPEELDRLLQSRFPPSGEPQVVPTHPPTSSP